MYTYRPKKRQTNNNGKIFVLFFLIMGGILYAAAFYFNIGEPKKDMANAEVKIPDHLLESKEKEVSGENNTVIEDGIGDNKKNDDAIDNTTEEDLSSLQTIYTIDATDKKQKKYIVSQIDNMLAVFEVNIDGVMQLIEKTDISIDTLPPQDQEMLMDGLEAYGDDELEAIMEGFSN